MRVRELLSAGAAVLVLCACSFPLTLGNRASQYQANTPALPVFNPATGTYSSDMGVAITSASVGAVIYYETGATDAATPVPNKKTSPQYSAPIAVTGNGTVLVIKAKTVLPGLDDSAVVTSTYTINYSQVSTPGFSPLGGVYTGDQDVSIFSDAGATIHFETGPDPASTPDPTTASPTFVSTIPVHGSGTTLTIKAMAVKAPLTPSTIAVANYAILYPTAAAPTILFSGTEAAPGVFVSPPTFTMSTSSSGADVHYTTDGSTPTSVSPVFTGPITISSPFSGTKLIRAITAGIGYNQSSEVMKVYQLPMIATDTAPASPYTNWYTVSSDASGTHRLAANYGGTLLISSNQGLNWSPPSSISGTHWQASTMSADGSYMYAAARDGAIYWSSDSGDHWYDSGSGTSAGGWYGLAATSSGNLVWAADNNGAVYQGASYGTLWTPLSVTAGGLMMAMSSNGTYGITSNSSHSLVMRSANGGLTWSDAGISQSGSWNAAAVSGAGDYMVAVAFGGDIWYSNDTGATWSAAGLSGRPWNGAAIASDGSRAAAVGTGYLTTGTRAGSIWTWTDQPLPPGMTGAILQAVACDQTGTILTVAVNGGSVWNIVVP